jgi:hypothetical protein
VGDQHPVFRIHLICKNVTDSFLITGYGVTLFCNSCAGIFGNGVLRGASGSAWNIRIILGRYFRPHKSEKLDPDPHLFQNSGALEVQNGAIEGRKCPIGG